MLTLFNTMSRRKEAFEPRVAGQAGIYVCGITVYDYCHIGHARSFVAFDLIRRWLLASGLRVTFVRNITDIDDKIIRRAVQNGESIHALTARFIDAMHDDERALAVLPPDHEPRATQFLGQMLSLVDRLHANGLAYVAPSGDVLYPVRRFAGYGRLSGRSLDELRAGERVDVSGDKNDPLDFVLWKSARADEPDEVKWPSRWGPGRPGWHLECSAMSTALLGSRFDIHGGGMDLQFPHHENEIAQSDGALFPDGSDSFVRYWMHNGFVQVGDEKMAKSLGNFSTIRDVLESFDGEVLRLFILRAHYRSPLHYAPRMLDDAREALLRLYGAVHALAAGGAAAVGGQGGSAAPVAGAAQPEPGVADRAGAAQPAAGAVTRFDRTDPLAERFAQALDDDFNTPVALAAMFELAGRIHRERQPADVALLRSMGAVLGLFAHDAETIRRHGLRGRAASPAGRSHDGAGGDGGGEAGAPTDARIDALVAERDAAKKARDFVRADAIRAQLRESGIELRDAPAGTTWQRR